jgi:NAD-dependent deacetylase
VVLTGAGISAESGLKTFRDGDGLWNGYNIQDVATHGHGERQTIGA